MTKKSWLGALWEILFEDVEAGNLSGFSLTFAFAGWTTALGSGKNYSSVNIPVFPILLKCSKLFGCIHKKVTEHWTIISQMPDMSLASNWTDHGPSCTAGRASRLAPCWALSNISEHNSPTACFLLIHCRRCPWPGCPGRRCPRASSSPSTRGGCPTATFQSWGWNLESDPVNRLHKCACGGRN